MGKSSGDQNRNQLSWPDSLPKLNAAAFTSARERYQQRWEGEGRRIELIVQGIRNHKDWTVYLGNFQDGSVSFCPLPLIEEADTHQGTQNPMDLRGIPLNSVDLSGCHLSGVSFQYATLHHVDLTNSVIQGSHTSFYGAHILGCTFRGSSLDHTRWGHSVISSSDFTDTSLYGAVFLEMTIRYSTFTGADLDHATFQEVNFYRPKMAGVRVTRNTNLGVRGRWQVIESRSDLMTTERSVRDGDYDDDDFPSRRSAYAHAAQIYRELKLAAKVDGLYDLAGAFHFRERKCDRLALDSHPISPARAWLLLQEIVMGYGEKPLRILAVVLATIRLFSLAFLFNGFEYSTASGVQRVDRELVFCPTEIRGTLQDLSLATYMSIVTFSTLGYGDAHPLGLTHWLASAEALAGLVLMALFVATIARVTIRD